jgi:hypothetical protein
MDWSIFTALILLFLYTYLPAQANELEDEE